MTLTEALPDRFSFYHLGEIKLDPDAGAAHATPDLEALKDLCGISFSFKNDLTGLLIVLFEKGLDSSIYTELGNVLASRMADKLAQDGTDVMITPPRTLSDHQLATILLSGQPMIHRTYQHILEGLIVPVHTLIIPIPSEEFGNA